MLVAAFLLAPATGLMAQAPPASEASEVQQLLKANCQQCHNEATRSSGLALTSRDALLSETPTLTFLLPKQNLVLVRQVRCRHH